SHRDAEALLAKHGLNAGPDGVRFVAETIFTARRRLRLEKGRRLYSIDRYRRALAHAEALLQYVDRPPARGVPAIMARAAKLHGLLNHPEVVTRFAVLRAQDLVAALERLASGALERSTLEELCVSLRAISNPAEQEQR